MANSFKKIRNKMSTETQSLAQANTKRMLSDMPLHELRQTPHSTQERLTEYQQVWEEIEALIISKL